MESLFIHLIKKKTFMTGFVVQGQHIYIDVYGCYSLHVYSLKCFVFRQYTQHWN